MRRIWILASLVLLAAVSSTDAQTLARATFTVRVQVVRAPVPRTDVSESGPAAVTTTDATSTSGPAPSVAEPSQAINAVFAAAGAIDAPADPAYVTPAPANRFRFVTINY